MKNKYKFLIILIIGIIIGSSLTVYSAYTYFSKDIKYTKKDGTQISVEDALNELYSKDNATYLYKANHFYTEYSSSWSGTQGISYINGININFYDTVGHATETIMISTEDIIDFSKYSKIIIDHDEIESTGTVIFGFYTDTEEELYKITTSKTKGIIEIDVSNINSSNKLSIFATTGTTTPYDNNFSVRNQYTGTVKVKINSIKLI